MTEQKKPPRSKRVGETEPRPPYPAPLGESAPETDETSQTRSMLVNEAQRILESQGYESLSLRSAAKAAGLSPAAPYRHFEHGAPELLAVVAERGFREMIAWLEKAAAPTEHGDPRERIIEMGLAYIRFGVERPDLYRALYSSQLARPLEFHEALWESGEISFSSRRAYQSLAAVKQHAFDVLSEPLADAQRKGLLREGNIDEFGLALAALVHGLVGEFIDEGLGARSSQKQPWSKVRRDMARRMIELLITGLQKF